MSNLRLNIPGFDDAINVPQWATEETLQEVAKQLGAKRSGINSLDVTAKKAAKSTKELTDAQMALKEAAESAANVAGRLAESLFNSDGSLNALTPVVDALASSIGKGIGGLGKLLGRFGLAGKAAGKVAGVLGKLGEAGAELATLGFDVLTRLADNFADGFRGAAEVGATLEGNFQELSSLQLKTNQGLEDLSANLNRASPALSAFTTSSEGARRVLGVLGTLQQEQGKQFARLGFTIADLNETGIDYLNILAQTGQTQMLQNMNERELAQQTGAYAANLAVLSRLTGQNRKELQQQMREEQMRANVQALLALKEGELDADQQETFRTLQVGLRNFSPQLADAFASISTLGVASAEQEAILAQLGPTGDLIRQFATAFRDGTANIGDTDVENILQSIAEGITSDDTLRQALLAPAGGFPQALAQVVGDGLQFAQKFIAGDVSLQQIREQVDLERQGRGELIDSIVDAQFNLATLSKTLQENVIAQGIVGDLVEGTANMVTATTEMLQKALTGELDIAEAFKQLTSIETDKIVVGGENGVVTDIPTGGGTVGADLRAGDYIYDRIIDAFDFIKKQFQDDDANAEQMNYGSAGIQDFGRGTKAFLHGKEAVIPAPRGNIPVDLPDLDTRIESAIANLKNEDLRLKLLSPFEKLKDQEALDRSPVNNVQSLRNTGAILEEMLSVLKAIADGQIGVMKTQSRGFKRLGNSMSGDLYRLN